MSAPTKERPPTDDTTYVPTVWMSGLGTNLRHAVRYWRATANGQVAALCGVTSPFWSSQQITGYGQVCRVCANRSGSGPEQ